MKKPSGWTCPQDLPKETIPRQLCSFSTVCPKLSLRKLVHTDSHGWVVWFARGGWLGRLAGLSAIGWVTHFVCSDIGGADRHHVRTKSLSDRKRGNRHYKGSSQPCMSKGFLLLGRQKSTFDSLNVKKVISPPAWGNQLNNVKYLIFLSAEPLFTCPCVTLLPIPRLISH